MTDAETRLKEAQDRINAARLKAVPIAHQSVTCGHCDAEVTWDDGYVCTPCGLTFDLDAETSSRYEDHEPECGAAPDPDTAKFWADGGMTLHPCNLTTGHETPEHHHPMTLNPAPEAVDA